MRNMTVSCCYSEVLLLLLPAWGCTSIALHDLVCVTMIDHGSMLTGKKIN